MDHSLKDLFLQRKECCPPWCWPVSSSILQLLHSFSLTINCSCDLRKILKFNIKIYLLVEIFLFFFFICLYSFKYFCLKSLRLIATAQLLVVDFSDKKIFVRIQANEEKQRRRKNSFNLHDISCNSFWSLTSMYLYDVFD